MKFHQTINIALGLTVGIALGRMIFFSLGLDSKLGSRTERSASLKIPTSVLNNTGVDVAAFLLYSSDQAEDISAPWSNRIDISERQNVELNKAWLGVMRSWVSMVASSSIRLNDNSWRAEPSEMEQKKLLRRLQLETENILGKEKATLLFLMGRHDLKKIFFSQHYMINIDRDLVAITPNSGPSSYSSERIRLQAGSALAELIGKLLR